MTSFVPASQLLTVIGGFIALGGGRAYRAPMSTNEIRCLADIPRVHAAARGDHPALTCGGRTVTFQAFYDRAQAVAAALVAEGVGPQDRIALIERNGIEVLEVVYGAALLNAVVVNINWRLAPPEILQILEDAGTSLVVVGPEQFGAVAAIEEELGDGARIVALAGHDRWEHYESWLARHEPCDPGKVAGPEDVAFQLYTSGTTGLPKGVMLTSSNVLMMVSRLGADQGLDASSVNMAVMPMFHIAGLGWSSLGLYAGCRTVVVARPGAVGCAAGDGGRRCHPHVRRAGRNPDVPPVPGGGHDRFPGPADSVLRGFAHFGGGTGASHGRHGL